MMDTQLELTYGGGGGGGGVGGCCGSGLLELLQAASSNAAAEALKIFVVLFIVFSSLDCQQRSLTRIAREQDHKTYKQLTKVVLT